MNSKLDKRICILMPANSWGGIERVNVHLINELIQMDLSVDLVLSRKSQIPYPELLKPECRIIDLQAKHKFTAIIKFTKYLKQNNPVAVLTAKDHGAKVGVLAKKLCFSKTKIFIVIHNSLDASEKNKVRILYSKLVYPLADGLIAVSIGAAESLQKLIPIPYQKLHVIHNPVISDDILEFAKESANHTWLLKGSSPVILGAGRLSPQKDFPTLIRAFALVRQQMNCRLLIIGEGHERKNLIQLAEELGVAKDFDLPGFISNPYPYFAGADLFVLSSAWEGFGNVLAEAMAVGTPVIATDCPSGPREILQNGKLGELVPVGDIQAMAQAILRTLQTESKSLDLQKTIRLFHARKIAKKYCKVLGVE